MNKETIGSVLAVVLVAAGGWYAYSTGYLGRGGSAAAGAAETVAVVNGENIPRSELMIAEARLTAGQSAATSSDAQAALQSQALDSVIGRALLLQAATQGGFTASSTVVEAELAAAKLQLGSQDAFDKALAAQGLTEATLRTQMGENSAIQAYLEAELHLSTLTVSDAEIQAAYDKVAAAQQGVPPLAQVKEQVKQLVLQQKQQDLITAQIAKLRAVGSVQILI